MLKDMRLATSYGSLQLLRNEGRQSFSNQTGGKKFTVSSRNEDHMVFFLAQRERKTKYI
tara:strand:+ start:469 stop:645 length:177 start_codon:yes stop_codon:yes gene_type:complete